MILVLCVPLRKFDQTCIFTTCFCEAKLRKRIFSKGFCEAKKFIYIRRVNIIIGDGNGAFVGRS